jgi:SnoaL-like protein
VAATEELTLDVRVQRIEDVEAIKRLMGSYGECVDNDYDLDGMRELLSEDLVWTSNAFGAYEGLEAYLAGQDEISKGVDWAFHQMVALRVDVDGDAATGTFYLLMLATFVASDDARVPIVLSARYDNEFARTAGGWRCSRMNVEFHQVSSLTEGWVGERFWQG